MISSRRPRSPIKAILVIFLGCFAFRMAEYLLLRTDQGIFGEAFVHKLAGLLVLFVALGYYSFKWSETGFASRSAGKFIFYGLLLGAAVFTLSYGVEYFIQASAGNAPSFNLYVTSYAIDGNQGREVGLQFFAFCVIGNIINVVMEEGVFRGLFVRLSEIKYSFLSAVIISSLLFGIWHIAAPLRSFLDGEMSPNGAVMTALMLVLTTALTGAKFCLLTKITGSLWMPMADHFLNNTIINMLHVQTASGADEFQVIRITIAQTVSFLVVLFIFWKTRAHRKATFRVW